MKIKKFNNYKDKRGNLYFNFYKDFNFKIKRIYFLKDFKKFSRGNHARKYGKKLYVCLNDKLNIFVENKKIKKNLILKTGDSIKIEKYNWVKIEGSPKSICLVLDSLEYNEKHYIRDKKKFMKIIKKK
ncbi:WxcM-like domain-containing protein [Candidatus Pelagibacter sp.]|nr:WxcM-like domain-containing protein [Candidatus Pelagibacter sp.]